MKQNLLKTWLMLVCLIVGVGSTWADNPVTLFHETFGDNSGSARNWSDTYSVKSGVSAVYSGITGYTVSNAKQGKNTTGSTASGLNQSTAGTDAYIIIGPLNVANCQSLALKYQWKAASVKGTYTTKAYYATSSTGSYTEITGGTGNGATTFVERSYSVPAAAQVSTLYLKIVWNTSNTQAIIDEVDLSGVQNNTPDPTPTVTAPTFDVVAGTYTENKTVKVSNYSSDYIYAYTTDGSDPAIDGELNVTSGTAYDNSEGITISSSCTLKMIAVDEDGNKSNITSASYVINKPYASLEALVAADLTSGTNVTVTFENVPIKSFQTVNDARKGVYFDIQKGGKDIEIYFSTAVPSEWVEGGTLSGTMTNCPWKLYNSTWELAPASGWAWTNLTYNAPAQKTITALEVSGTPTKTTYNVGDAFETAGLTVTATYSDETQEVISTGFEWEIDYGTGNEALVAGATSVDVMAYIDEVMSDVYTVNGLTVTVPVTLTSIAVSGTPTKTEYYDGDAFETAGLVVTGTYSDSHQETITEGIEWTIDPETLTLGTTSVDVIAGVGSIVSEIYTVNGLTVTENPYKTATISSFSGTSGDISTGISYEAFQGKASTAPAVYDNSLRLYQNGGYVTVTAVTGLKIASVKITTSDTYNSTTVGYCVDNENAPTTGETVAKESSYTINGLNNKSVSIYCLGTDKNTRLEISAMEVTYSGTPVVELSNIALSGTYPTEFTKGAEFTHEGMTVTANYTDGSDNDVTSEATFSGYDMNTIGEQTVTVSYTENEITKIAQYTINVKKAPFVPTPATEGYEVVDFTTIYSSVDANVEDYEGTSFAMAFAKPQGSSTPTKYYVKGNAVRAYVGNTITITGAEAITGVHMGWAEDYVDDEVSITGLGTTTAVVTFSKTCRFTDIAVCYNTLTLNEGSTTVASIVDVPYGEVTVNRNLKAGVWNTFCVPFDMSRAEIEANFGEGASVKALKPDYLYVSGLNFGINFIDATSIKAGVPYMVMIDGEEKASFTVNGAKVNTTALNDVTVSNGGNSLTFHGNYTSMKALDASFIISSNKFYYVDSDVTVNGFRGYITTVSESGEGGSVRALSFGFGEGITTGISTNLSAEQQNARIYNLQGMQQSKLSKGVNIVNGRKIIK